MDPRAICYVAVHPVPQCSSDSSALESFDYNMEPNAEFALSELMRMLLVNKYIDSSLHVAAEASIEDPNTERRSATVLVLGGHELIQVTTRQNIDVLLSYNVIDRAKKDDDLQEKCKFVDAGGLLDLLYPR
jgi:hypothetical protein